MSSRPPSANPPRLVAVDLDGTLLPSGGRAISARNFAALHLATRRGARVVVATGRSPASLAPLADGGFTGVAVCLNGALVYDMARGTVLAHRPMPVARLHEVVARLTGAGLSVQVAAERLDDGRPVIWAHPAYPQVWPEHTVHYADAGVVTSEPALKLMVWCAGLTSAEAAAEAARVGITPDVASVSYSEDDGRIDVGAAGVEKGTELRRLATSWNVGPAAVAAIGDMPNDLGMLEWAGYAVAMGNAHDSVKRIADEVAPAQEQDGVAVVLERWFGASRT